MPLQLLLKWEILCCESTVSVVAHREQARSHNIAGAVRCREIRDDLLWELARNLLMLCGSTERNNREQACHKAHALFIATREASDLL